ncbi:MAG: hypothetical protein ACWGOX_11860 [Desulforhopalus sp.]
MDTVQVAKQTLSFQKTIFTNAFEALVFTQDQTEKMMNTFIEKLPFSTEQGKKTLVTTFDMGKKARDDFKKVVDEGYLKLEEMLEKK